MSVRYKAGGRAQRTQQGIKTIHIAHWDSSDGQGRGGRREKQRIALFALGDFLGSGLVCNCLCVRVKIMDLGRTTC